MCPSEAMEKENADREECRLQELDDDEYDALPDEEKEQIIQEYREKLNQKKRKYK